MQSSGLSALPEEQQKILRGYQREMVNHMSDIICDIAPEVFGQDARKLYAATMSVYGMLNWFYMWHRPGKGLSRSEYATLAADFVRGGISAV